MAIMAVSSPTETVVVIKLALIKAQLMPVGGGSRGHRTGALSAPGWEAWDAPVNISNGCAMASGFERWT